MNKIKEHEHDFMSTTSDADIDLIINTVNKDYQRALKETSNYLTKNQTLIKYFNHSQNLHIHRIKIRLKVSKFKRL